VRLSPARKKTVGHLPKPKKQRKGKKKGEADHDAQPSTNVSSPIRRKPPRQVVQHNNSDGSDGFDPAPNLTTNAYQLDDFVVDDDDVDYEPDQNMYEQSFEPSTPSNRVSNANNGGGLSMGSLSPDRRAAAEGIIAASQLQCRSIMMSKSLRRQPFSDTILREIALRNPKTKNDMLTIPEINPDMVRLYGDIFLKIVSNSMKVYGQLKGFVELSPTGKQSENQTARARTVRMQSFKPYDPNHQEVITIDDDEPEPGENSDENNKLEQSHYFAQKPSAEVAKYNAFWDQSQGQSSKIPRYSANRTSNSHRKGSNGQGSPSKGKTVSKKRDFGNAAMDKKKKSGKKEGKSSLSGGIGMMPT
jgi:bloom syndrome protein